MLITTPDALAELCAPWAKLYSHSDVLPTVVTFLHIAPIIVGGGLAIALDRTTLRIGDDADARRRHLDEVGRAHRPVIVALALSLLSGLALLAADLDTFLGSWVFWAKMWLIVALLVNGALMTRSERRLREGRTDQWGRLRVLAFTSLFLWLVITYAGVALVNAA